MVKKNKNKDKESGDKVKISKTEVDSLFKKFKSGSKTIKKNSESNEKKPKETE